MSQAKLDGTIVLMTLESLIDGVEFARCHYSLVYGVLRATKRANQTFILRYLFFAVALESKEWNGTTVYSSMMMTIDEKQTKNRAKMRKLKKAKALRC